MQELRDIAVCCPYCGEMIDTTIDESAGPQSYYEDCPVCCAPIMCDITETASGELEIHVRRDDE